MKDPDLGRRSPGSVLRPLASVESSLTELGVQVPGLVQGPAPAMCGDQPVVGSDSRLEHPNGPHRSDHDPATKTTSVL